jgi:hypothetical protein
MHTGLSVSAFKRQRRPQVGVLLLLLLLLLLLFSPSPLWVASGVFRLLGGPNLAAADVNTELRFEHDCEHFDQV